MAKKEQGYTPTLTLADIISELESTNYNLFTLKQGTQKLIEVVEQGGDQSAKHVIDVFQLKEVLKKLSPNQ